MLILIGGLLIMIFVIPYAFSSVIKQLEAEAALNEAKQKAIREELERRRLIAEAAANATEVTVDPNE